MAYGLLEALEALEELEALEALKTLEVLESKSLKPLAMSHERRRRRFIAAATPALTANDAEKRAFCLTYLI